MLSLTKMQTFEVLRSGMQELSSSAYESSCEIQPFAGA
ncbi:hypothetical protein BH23ACT11_BH23ACT11_30700 [soil metagenome]